MTMHKSLKNQVLQPGEDAPLNAKQAATSLAHTLSSLVSEWKGSITFRDDLTAEEQDEEISNMAKIVASVKTMHPEITEFYDILERNRE